MKYLKSFNEAVLRGKDISENIEMLKNRIKKGTKITEPKQLTNQLNYQFSISGDNVFFVEVDDIINQIPGVSCYSNKTSEYGMKGAFIVSNGIIFVIVDRSELLNNIYKNTDETIFTIKKILNHELIHREQYKKIGDKIIQILKSKKDNGVSSRYYEEPREIMAYAKTIIDELEEIFDKKAILNFLRWGISVGSPTLQLYKKQVNQKSYRKLLKYIYQYLTQDDKES